MYKFEISADSPSELRQKMLEFANEMQMDQKVDAGIYIDDVEEETHVPLSNFDSSIFAPVPPPFIKTQTDQQSVPLPAVSISQNKVQAAVSPNVDVIKDSNGFIWEANIHASNKTLNKNGTWRYKRGVDEETIKKYEQSNVNPPPVNPPPVNPPLVGSVHPPRQVVEAVIVKPVEQTYENITIPPGVRSAHSLITFKNNLTSILAQLINENKITQEYIAQLQEYFEVKHIWSITDTESQAIELFDLFVNHGFLTKVD